MLKQVHGTRYAGLRNLWASRQMSKYVHRRARRSENHQEQASVFETEFDRSGDPEACKLLFLHPAEVYYYSSLNFTVYSLTTNGTLPVIVISCDFLITLNIITTCV